MARIRLPAILCELLVKLGKELEVTRRLSFVIMLSSLLQHLKGKFDFFLASYLNKFSDNIYSLFKELYPGALAGENVVQTGLFC